MQEASSAAGFYPLFRSEEFRSLCSLSLPGAPRKGIPDKLGINSQHSCRSAVWKKRLWTARHADLWASLLFHGACLMYPQVASHWTLINQSDKCFNNWFNSWSSLSVWRISVYFMAQLRGEEKTGTLSDTKYPEISVPPSLDANLGLWMGCKRVKAVLWSEDDISVWASEHRSVDVLSFIKCSLSCYLVCIESFFHAYKALISLTRSFGFFLWTLTQIAHCFMHFFPPFSPLLHFAMECLM